MKKKSIIEDTFENLLGADYLDKPFKVKESKLQYIDPDDTVTFRIVNYCYEPGVKVLMVLTQKPDLRMAEWFFASKVDVSHSNNFKDFMWSTELGGVSNELFYYPEMLLDFFKHVGFEGNKYYQFENKVEPKKSAIQYKKQTCCCSNCVVHTFKKYNVPED